MASRSHSERSWCSSSTRRRPRPCGTPAGRGSPAAGRGARAASGSSGMSATSRRARSRARTGRSARTSSWPDGAVWPVVCSRWTTVRTASRRAGRSAAAGTANGIPRGGDLLLGARDPRRHGRLGHEEGARDVGGRHAAHQPQRERHLGLRRGAPDGSTGRRASAGRRGWRRRRSRRASRSPRARAAGAACAEGAARAMALRALRRAATVSQAPGDGHAIARPGPQRGDVRVLHALLGQVEVARDARRRGEHERPLATVRVGDRRATCGGAAASVPSGENPMSGRTSTPPSMIGVMPARASAWSRSRASSTKTPASASLLSMNGPSVTRPPRIVVAVPVCSSASPAMIAPPASLTRSGRAVGRQHLVRDVGDPAGGLALEDHHRVLGHQTLLASTGTPSNQRRSASPSAVGVDSATEVVERDPDRPPPCVTAVDAQERVGGADAEKLRARPVDHAVDGVEPRRRQTHAVARRGRGRDAEGRPHGRHRRTPPVRGLRRRPAPARRTSARTPPTSAGRAPCGRGRRPPAPRTPGPRTPSCGGSAGGCPRRAARAGTPAR